MNGVVTPRSGAQLLVMDRRGGPVMGYLRVTTVGSTTFRATLEPVDVVWVGYINRAVSEHTPFVTTARAILMEHQGMEDQP